MNELELLYKRWNELVGRPRSKEEIEETLSLAKKIELESAKELSTLIAELKEKGLSITSIWDLVNSNKTYPQAIDILIKYLPNDYSEKNKEGIVRALTVKAAKGKAASVLIEEYNRTAKEKDNLRWVIGNAIATVMTLQDVERILSIVTDRSNGNSRMQLVVALGTVKSKQVQDALTGLLNDEAMATIAQKSLNRSLSH
jgi:HEAT repeat protein